VVRKVRVQPLIRVRGEIIEATFALMSSCSDMLLEGAVEHGWVDTLVREVVRMTRRIYAVSSLALLWLSEGLKVSWMGARKSCQ
jgi:hypothetical protein